jgi:hypothetical protein
MPCILIGTMYIDKEKMQLLRFEGEVKGYTMKVNVGDRAAMVPGECRVKVQYTHQRGFTEVEKSDCIVSCLGRTYNLQLINLGEKKIKGEPSVPVDGDIIHAIRQAGYNSKLMESEAVRSIIAIPHP